MPQIFVFPLVLILVLVCTSFCGTSALAQVAYNYASCDLQKIEYGCSHIQRNNIGIKVDHQFRVVCLDECGTEYVEILKAEKFDWDGEIYSYWRGGPFFIRRAFDPILRECRVNTAHSLQLSERKRYLSLFQQGDLLVRDLVFVMKSILKMGSSSSSYEIYSFLRSRGLSEVQLKVIEIAQKLIISGSESRVFVSLEPFDLMADVRSNLEVWSTLRPELVPLYGKWIFAFKGLEALKPVVAAVNAKSKHPEIEVDPLGRKCLPETDLEQMRDVQTTKANEALKTVLESMNFYPDLGDINVQRLLPPTDHGVIQKILLDRLSEGRGSETNLNVEIEALSVEFGDSNGTVELIVPEYRKEFPIDPDGLRDEFFGCRNLSIPKPRKPMCTGKGEESSSSTISDFIPKTDLDSSEPWILANTRHSSSWGEYGLHWASGKIKASLIGPKREMTADWVKRVDVAAIEIPNAFKNFENKIDFTRYILSLKNEYWYKLMNFDLKTHPCRLVDEDGNSPVLFVDGEKKDWPKCD